MGRVISTTCNETTIEVVCLHKGQNLGGEKNGRTIGSENPGGLQMGNWEKKPTTYPMPKTLAKRSKGERAEKTVGGGEEMASQSSLAPEEVLKKKERE